MDLLYDDILNTAKAQKVIFVLRRLLPNEVKLTHTGTRKILLNGASNSIILYAALVWLEVYKYVKYRTTLEKTLKPVHPKEQKSYQQ